ncbi:D-glycero-beta-D-manno-heptose 1,7-bisphosphate 7-phosphatase [Pelomonas sp. Root1217]|uniref:D-glycero-beta-D-manno-heptose 1,7-bisphosphate 7-phosphatase n=1 Tax=Pelomonas sp. Root1217 TaxID=1736430 RepID=UPI000B28362B|nr:D-glycero-beta-D-manno-heptose 1,7-bisphosphate 7-phosphatase [Pelomonas sp. Root1217]
MRADHAHGMKLVILGRDGTINRYRDDHVKAPEELDPLPGALEAVARLNHAGWHTVLATNQAGIGRGLLDMASLNAVHIRLNQLLAEKGGRLDAAFFCPHTPEEGCDCRKPLPGLIQQIGERFDVALATIHMVGASLTDLLTAQNAGCMPHLVLTGPFGSLGTNELANLLVQVPTARVHDDLMSFAETIIQEERRRVAVQRGQVLTPDTQAGDLN